MIDGRLRRRIGLASLFLSAGLLAGGCAPRSRPALLPPGRAAEEVLRELTGGCREIKDYAARGQLTVSRDRWIMEAEERVLYGAPDRLRVHLRYRGFLGMLPADLDLLLRGDSVYVAAEPGSAGWRGTRRELAALWPREGPLLLAALEELGPAGPLDCREIPVPSPESPPASVAGRRGKGMALWLSPGTGEAFRRVVWVDPGERVLRASDVYDEEARLLARVTYQEFGTLGRAACPASIQVEYPREKATVALRHEAQRANLGLADSLFEPGRPWGGDEVWGIP